MPQPLDSEARTPSATGRRRPPGNRRVPTSLSRVLQASETQSRTIPMNHPSHREDDAADRQHDQSADLLPADLPRRQPEALPRLGCDLLGVPQTIQERSDRGLVLALQVRTGLDDVLGDLVDKLAPPRSGKAAELGVQALQIVLDELVSRGAHVSVLSTKWSTASRNRRHSSLNPSSAARPPSVKR